jgi:uncharacterized membrane protein HdeD (DUF308 family)
MSGADPTTRIDPATMRSSWGVIVIAGVLMVILGILAIGSTVVTTLATAVFLGILLLIAGVAQIASAFSAPSRRDGILQFLIALLYLLAGWQLVARPFFGALAVTLVIGAVLIVVGLARLFSAFTVRPPHWGWLALNGLVTVAIGLFLWAGWPLTGIVALGLFLGIELVISGIEWVIVGFRGRSSAPESRGSAA